MLRTRQRPATAARSDQRERPIDNTPAAGQKGRHMSTVPDPKSPRCSRPVVADAPPDERDPTTWPPQALARIQRVLDRSRERAGQAVRDTFNRDERQMSALEFIAFWNGIRLKAMATVGASTAPHVAPVHAEFVNGQLRTTIYENALRRQDLSANPRVALTTWGADGAAAIVSGRAREIPDTLRETRPGATGATRRTVALEITVTRIYAMKPRGPVAG